VDLAMEYSLSMIQKAKAFFGAGIAENSWGNMASVQFA